MNTKTELLSPFDRARARRLDARRSRLGPQVDAALRALVAMGVKARLVGSWAEGRMGEHSDIDFLVEDRCGASMAQVYDAIASQLRDAPFDVMYWDSLSHTGREIMRQTHG